jgi:hypothetical protein
LRHKEIWLKGGDKDHELNSAKRGGKSKHPDFYRTLDNYVKRQQERGIEIRDSDLMEQARLFAHASGNTDDVLESLTPTWLRKYKQKLQGGRGKLTRRASETNIPDSARMSMARPAANDKTSRITSPVSAGGKMSPLSEGRSDEDMTNDDFDFNYGQPASQSTTSLSSDVRDAGTSSFPGSALSPNAAFTFSPELAMGAFQVDHGMQMRPGGTDFHHREKRSNTFPSLNIDYANQTTAAEPMTPRLPGVHGTTPSSAIESPANEMQSNMMASNVASSLDTALTSSPTLRRTSSNSSMTGRATVANAVNTALPPSVESSPVSPSQEDARRAANTLLNYMNSLGAQGTFEQNELVAIMQLTNRLNLHQHSAGRPSRSGLSRIPEGDNEVPAATEMTMNST